MNPIELWLNDHDKWSRPDPGENEGLYRDTFGSPSGQRLLARWIGDINMTPPKSLDAYEIAHWQGRCQLVSDIVRALDTINNPDKYRPMDGPRKISIIGGQTR